MKTGKVLLPTILLVMVIGCSSPKYQHTRGRTESVTIPSGSVLMEVIRPTDIRIKGPNGYYTPESFYLPVRVTNNSNYSIHMKGGTRDYITPRIQLSFRNRLDNKLYHSITTNHLNSTGYDSYNNNLYVGRNEVRTGYITVSNLPPDLKWDEVDVSIEVYDWYQTYTEYYYE